MRKVALALAVLLAWPVAPGMAQSRIKSMPGYDNWARVAPEIPRAVKLGSINPEWADDSKSFEFELEGKRWRFDLEKMASAEAPPKVVDADTPSLAPAAPSASLVLARGRGKETEVFTTDRRTRAFTRDGNLWISDANGQNEKQVTTDGGPATRIRNGVGSYVYLEEFSVTQPVWFSPDGRKLAWMRYDESMVDDYFLPLDQTKQFTRTLSEAYPHPGHSNPVADLMVYDLDTARTTRMDVRDGRPFANDVVGHYVWNAQWTKDGTEILVRRADRRQKVYDLAACEPVTGKCRSVVREARPQSWAAGSPPTFLEDGKRFIWVSERSDFKNLYLYNLQGMLLTRLTRGAYDVVDIVKVDERNGWIWYTARSGDNHMKVQLHRVRLNGQNDKTLTDPSLTHRVDISPNGLYFVDVAQAHDRPPVSRLMDINGKVLADLATSDVSAAIQLGLKPAELFTFTAADGKTPLHGMLQFPSDFDPSKKYPMLVSVYGGPASAGLTEQYAAANPLAEYGFLFLRLDARTNAGMGRKQLDGAYQQLGIVEMDDFAAGIRSLWKRAYVDKDRVGIYGTSYGGTSAATVLLRHPEVVQAAVSNSPVTDYRLYDTAYSERYLGLPESDAKAYDQAAVLTYASQLRDDRDLMVYYGTSDDNVHPNNALQFIKGLQAAGKSFEVQVGPDKGHTGVDVTRMMEFFIDKLVLAPRSAGPGGLARAPSAAVSGPSP